MTFTHTAQRLARAAATLAAACVVLASGGCVTNPPAPPADPAAPAQPAPSAPVPKKPARAPWQPQPVPKPIGQPIQGDIDAAKALAHLYGEVRGVGTATVAVPATQTRDCSAQALRAQRPLPEKYLADFPQERGGTIETCPVLEERYTDQGREKYMLLTLSVPTHQGNNIIGASIFAKNGAQWALEAHEDSISEKISAITIRPAGQGIPGALAISSGGENCIAWYVAAILPHAGGVREFLLGDYGEVLLCTTDTFAEAHFDAESPGAYHDIVVLEKDAEGKVQSQQRWRFQDGEYANISPKPKTTTARRQTSTRSRSSARNSSRGKSSAKSNAKTSAKKTNNTKGKAKTSAKKKRT